MGRGADPEYLYWGGLDVACRVSRLLGALLQCPHNYPSGLWTSCLIRLYPGLSVRDVVRSAEVGVWRALGINSVVVRGREQSSSPIVITLVLSPELSLGDVGKAAGGDVVLTLSISIGGGWM